MVQISRKSFTVTTEGVGRPDYSMNVELAVEPQIRSWQTEYKHAEDIAVPAYSSVTREIDIEAKTVILIYDFYISVPRNIMLHLDVDFFTATGTWESMTDKSDLQTVEIHYVRGFPLFDKYRITITNYSGFDITCPFSAHGVITAENIYYGRLVE
ncbi:hypothetical protein ES703_49598 [subsurface metagenome]